MGITHGKLLATAGTIAGNLTPQIDEWHGCQQAYEEDGHEVVHVSNSCWGGGNGSAACGVALPDPGGIEGFWSKLLVDDAATAIVAVKVHLELATMEKQPGFGGVWMRSFQGDNT